MTETTRSIPMPLGELLERLRAEGFAVTPEVYGRVIRVLDAYYPAGIAPGGDATASDQLSAADTQTLKELLGPVIARSEAEQLKFPLIFDEVCKRRPAAGPVVPPVVPSSPVLPVKRLLAALAFVLLLMGSWPAYQWWDGKENLPMPKRGNDSALDPAVGPERRDDSVAAAKNNLPAKEARASVPLIRAPEVRNVSYQLAAWVPLLLSSLVVGVAGVGLYAATARRRKAKLKDQPPYSFSFPNQEKEIYVSRSVERWANQLQQRDEGQSRLVDLRKSIRATVKNGGYPIVCYKNPGHKPSYVVLIDNWSAHHQQARLYAFLAGCLAESNVALETFFFHEDPRYCWNEKHPGGLPVADVYRLHGTAHLVMITEGKRLVDHQHGKVAAWFAEPLAHWPSRILLTPVYPGHWNYLEATLSQFFVVLPATPDGQLRLREFLHVTALPAFTEMRDLFEPGTHTPPDRGAFGKSTAEMSVPDVSRLLNQSFRVEPISDREKEYLNQWAYSTAVYLPPNWEVTIAIGKAIERHSGVANLVNTTNLLKITALPWLKGGSIPAGLAQELLGALYPDVQAVARREVERLLVEVKAAPGSNAEEEKQIQLWEQRLHGGNGRQRREAARELRPFQKAGLLGNAATAHEVTKYYLLLKGGYAIAALVLVVLICWLLRFFSGEAAGDVPDFPGREVAYEEITSGPDSAVYYNNLAADTFNNGNTASGGEKSRYLVAMRYLALSARKQMMFQTMYNMHALRYNLGLYYYHQDAARADDSVSMVLSPGNEVQEMMRPVLLLKQNPILRKDSLVKYLRLLFDGADADAIRTFLEGESKAGGGRVTTNGDNDRSDGKTLLLAVQGAKMKLSLSDLHILQWADSRLGSDTSDFAKDYFPSLMDTSKWYRDSILSIEANRILLYYRKPGGALVDPVPLPFKPDSLKKGTPKPVPQPEDSVPSENITPPESLPDTVRLIDTTTVHEDGPGEYGVLVGLLKDVKYGTNGFLYVEAQAGQERYRVALRVKNSQAGQWPIVTASPLIIALKGWQVEDLLPYRFGRAQSEGFYPLQNQFVNAFDYRRTDKLIRKNVDKPITSSQLYELLEALSKSYRKPTDKLRVYIWGDRWQPNDEDAYFGLKLGYREIRNVHRRRGTPAVRTHKDVPWEDGAIIVDHIKESAGGLLSRFQVKLPLVVLIEFNTGAPEFNADEDVVR